VRHERSLVGLTAALPTLGGACCVGLGADLATLGGLAGAVLAWLQPMLLAAALLVLGAVLLRLRRSPLRRWHALLGVAATAQLATALLVLPAIGLLTGDSNPTAGTGPLP
jgi:hypothetical protein